MRRDLTIRCASTGTVRTDGPDGAWCELRDIGLELDGALAHVRSVETFDAGQRTRDTTVEFSRIAVRSHTSLDLAPPNSTRTAPLDWLLAIVGSMKEGELYTVALWVRSMDAAALLHATPVTEGGLGMPAHEAGQEEGSSPAPLSPSPRLRLIATGS